MKKTNFLMTKHGSGTLKLFLGLSSFFFLHEYSTVLKVGGDMYNYFFDICTLGLQGGQKLQAESWSQHFIISRVSQNAAWRLKL